MANRKETAPEISPGNSRRKANGTKEGRHCFSIELKSKEFLRNLTISNRPGETVLLEGFLGELEEMSLVEGGLLEVTGSNGVLRIDVNEEDLETLLARVAPRILKKRGENENRSANHPEHPVSVKVGMGI